MHTPPLNEASPDTRKPPARSASSPLDVFSRACRTRAFTLVEIIVVVSIILILAALLLPVARNMIAKGLSGQCVSQLHQIGVIFSLYEGDHQLYPGAFMTNYPGQTANQSWYQGGTPLDMYCSGTDRTVNLSVLAICPCARKQLPVMPSLTKVPGYPYLYNTYVMNSSSGTTIRVGTLNGRKPSSLVMLVDQSINVSQGSGIQAFSDYTPHMTNYHLGSTSILWADNHVSQKNCTNLQAGDFISTLAQPTQ